MNAEPTPEQEQALLDAQVQLDIQIAVLEAAIRKAEDV
jgi:hypothetical protein